AASMEAAEWPLPLAPSLFLTLSFAMDQDSLLLDRPAVFFLVVFFFPPALAALAAGLAADFFLVVFFFLLVAGESAAGAAEAVFRSRGPWTWPSVLPPRTATRDL